MNFNKNKKIQIEFFFDVSFHNIISKVKPLALIFDKA